MIHRTSLLALCVLLCGCAGMSPKDNQRFQAEVLKDVPVNTSLTDAIDRLNKADFSCEALDEGAVMSCTRLTTSLLLHSCLQRVDLTADSNLTLVKAVTPQPIVCTGKQG